MKKILLLFFFTVFANLYSQEYIFGKVTSEQNTEIAGVLVINIKADAESYTNKDGNFTSNFIGHNAKWNLKEHLCQRVSADGDTH